MLVREVCEELGLIVWIEPDYGYVGYIEYPHGKRHLFRNTNFNVNPLWSIEICKDKEYSALFLKKFGYKVPEGEVFFSDTLNKNIWKQKTVEDGRIYARSLWFPCIIKPNNLSQWSWVRKLMNEDEYSDAVEDILQKSNVFRIERFSSGNDYRVVVFDDEIISAYQRIPLFVVWDGIQTIAELLSTKQELFIKEGRDTIIDISDPRMQILLDRKWYSFDTILDHYEEFQLLDNANLSTGWESIDVTTTLHDDFKNIAIQATKDMWLRLCGVDFIVDDITKSLNENHEKYIIIEINEAPWLDNYMSAWSTQRNNVKDLYRKIIVALSKEY